MSEIREYRGKRVDNGEWVYGLPYNGYAFLSGEYIGIQTTIESVSGKKNIFAQYGVDPETVGQYTGRNERPFGIKSDKKIYNGDKVCCYGGESCQGYWEYQTEFIVDDMDSDKMVMLDAYDYVDIIGNIHDNPELLESEVQNDKS